MKKIIAFLLSLIATTNSFSQKELTVKDVHGSALFAPRAFYGSYSTPDGLNYLKIEDNKLKAIPYDDKKKNKTRVIMDISSIPMEMDDYTINSTETKVLMAFEQKSIYRHSTVANYYIYDIKGKSLEKLSPSEKLQSLATFSPDGTKVAYILENNLFYKDLATSITTQITFDGKINEIINGTTDWVYEEEFAITQAFGWSPDGKHIGFLRFDESQVREFTMEYNVGELYPELYTFKYPKAGEDNSKVSAHIYSVDTKKTTAIQLNNYEYIPRISWSTVNNTLVLQTLNRHQNEVNYYKVEQKNDAWKASVFFTETSKTYIDIDDNLIFLNDGKSILRTSEKDGFKHIYQIGFDGSEYQITKGNWDVIDFSGIDAKNKFVYYTAAKKGAIHKGIYKIDLITKKDVAISSETGQNNAEFVTGMTYFIKKYSNANTPPTYTFCDNNGKELKTLEGNETLKERIKTYQFSPKEFVQFDLKGRSLNGWMIKPANFDASKKYPVYIYIYGGPGSNTVIDGWDSNLAWHQLLAQKGYIVVSVDPRGTQFRGKDFKDKTYLQLGKCETEDFIDVAKLLQTYSYVDKDRIGIQGWSYGGFMTSLAMTKGNGLFKMGIAVAPVTNWKYYDNIYTERFMRTPKENMSGYDDNSPINFTNQLQGNYFLIHGSGDDNVHYQNALEMVNALVKSNKQFDLFIYPNRNHGIYGGNTRVHLYTMMLNYISTKL
jgi:dipeptidyl-peptidase 4